jgi:hypothetical protein
MAKFDALAAYCNEQTLQVFDLPFHKIEGLIGEKLPKSAYRPQYWANTNAKSGSVAKAMASTRYETFLVAGSKRVQFRRFAR